MPRGKYLAYDEIIKIKTLKESGYSVEEICNILNKSRSTVYKYLKIKETPEKLKIGRPKGVTERQRRSVLRCASNSLESASKIRTKLQLDVSTRTVQRIIKDCSHIKRKKIQRKPLLRPKHIEDRLSFAKHHMSWTTEWEKVIFSDEKKFNLDGPDGYDFYFHDLRKDPVVMSRRQQGGGSLMVWRAICIKGPIQLKIVKGNQNAEKYLQLLKEQMLAFREKMETSDIIFQQDNASIHKARVVMNWFTEQNIQVLQWPACSPDLNIIENAWGYLSRKVYEGGKQYSNIQELKVVVEREWKNMPLQYIQNLYKSIPNRIYELILKSCKQTKY